jgi:transposase InsO family protein
MPWNEVDRMSLRNEFVELARREDWNFSELCRRYGISRKTGYKWLARYRQGGRENLRDRSRRPQHCPHQTTAEMEAKIVTLRKEKPAWGGRKLRTALQRSGVAAPSASTITVILRRQQILEAQDGTTPRPYQRFEKEHPNELWQMDFKGDFPTLQRRCYPLTLLDDCTRFSPGLFSCGDQRRETVQSHLEAVFRRYGMPHAMLMDNGSPWGGGDTREHTRLSVWLMRLGIRVKHGRPYHPQTQGKLERFHRTLQGEVLVRESFVDLTACQQRLDAWREEYNFVRPHEALEMATPGSRYRPSPLAYPEALPPIEYAPGGLVRKVQNGGRITYRNREYRVGHAFVGLPVALRPTAVDGILEVWFLQHPIKILDLRATERSGDSFPREREAE